MALAALHVLNEMPMWGSQAQTSNRLETVRDASIEKNKAIVGMKVPAFISRNVLIECLESQLLHINVLCRFLNYNNNLTISWGGRLSKTI